MLKTKIMSKKLTSLGIERQSDLLQVIFIFRINENKFTEIKSNFVDVFSPILRYHLAHNQGNGEKTDESQN